MSAYNQAQYNLGKYNVSALGQIWAAGESKLTIGFSYAGTTYQAKGNAAVRMQAGDLKLDRGQIASGSAAEQFGQSAYVNGYFWITAQSREEFAPEINLSQDVQAAGHSIEEFAAEINLSQDVQAAGHSIEEFAAEINLSQIVQTIGISGEIFDATADVFSLSGSICEFPGLILSPGQMLVIDAGSYNVLLDGENAIHYQKGDWIDNLNRNTQSIVISATGINRVAAEILYTERYL